MSTNLVPTERGWRIRLGGSDSRLSVLAIQFQCHECGKTISVKDELAGKRVKCPCGAVVTATAAAPTATAGAARPARPAPARPVPARPVAARPAVQTSTAARAGTARPAPGLPASGNPYIAGSNDLSSLFDELTESDLQTKRERDQQAADSQAAVKDPLAAYRPDKGGKASRPGGAGPRPVGLTILAVLNFLIAALMLTLGVLFLVGTQAFGDALAEVEFLQEVATAIAVTILIAGGFCAATGAGLLSGQPWGWWLGTTVYTYSAFDGIFSIIFALLEAAPPDTAFKNVGRVLFAIGVVSYLFNEERRAYYRIQTKPAIAAVIVIGTMAVLAFALQLGLHLMVEDVPAQ